jgi:hypothetical protein
MSSGRRMPPLVFMGVPQRKQRACGGGLRPSLVFGEGIRGSVGGACDGHGPPLE